jgi:branched-chain amino acid transport system substrate-binding protein
MRLDRLTGGGLVASLFLALHAPAPGGDAIKIGVQLPLTGERAAVGGVIKGAVEMAVREVNSQGGVNGAPLAPVYVDSQNSAEGAVAAVRTLAGDLDVVAILGELFSPFALASRDVVDAADVPYLIGGTSPRTTEHAEWVYRVGASDALLAALVARYIAQDSTRRRIAVLSSRPGVHDARAELVVKVLTEKYGLPPVVRETWTPEARDFTGPLQKVKAAQVDAIIAFGETGEGAPFLTQAKALGIDARVIAHRDFGARSVLAEAGPAAEGLVIVTEYLPALMDPDRQAWARRYQERHGTEPSIIAAQYYDAVLLVAAAIKGGGPDRVRVKSGLEQLDRFSGVMADYTFDAQHNGVHRFLVARISGGKPVLEAILAE